MRGTLSTPYQYNSHSPKKGKSKLPPKKAKKKASLLGLTQRGRNATILGFVCLSAGPGLLNSFVNDLQMMVSGRLLLVQTLGCAVRGPKHLFYLLGPKVIQVWRDNTESYRKGCAMFRDGDGRKWQQHTSQF